MRPAGGSSGAAASSRDGALGETRLPIEQERISAKAFVPPWVRFAHVARYDFAAAFVREKRVVDGACGSGYGSAMLASAGARSVLGLDIADDGLREATETYDAPNLSFRKCDLSTLDVPASSCDVFISFETIEHVPDDGAFLSGNRRALAPDGVFCARRRTAPLPIRERPSSIGPIIAFHLREYDRHELAERLRAHFAAVDILGQTFWERGYASALRALSSAHPLAAVRSHQIRKVVTSLRDRFENYRPRPIEDGAEPEVLLAISRP